MRTLKFLAVLCCLSTVAYAGELNEADKKWSGAVEKMIIEGVTTISTPSESRAQLAKELAGKHGRDSQIKTVASGYQVVIQPTKLANK